MADYPFAQRPRMRGLAKAIAELAVDYSVPDLFDHTITVERRRATEVSEQLFSRARRCAGFQLRTPRSQENLLGYPVGGTYLQFYLQSCRQKTGSPRYLIGNKWSGREDLNLRPPGPEPGAKPC